MAIPFRKSADAKRQEKVRVVLGSEHLRKKRWLHSFGRFIANYYVPILITAMTVACIYAHIYFYNTLTVMKQQTSNLSAQIEAGLQMRENIVTGLTDVVKGFITHEEGIFTSAMETRKDSMAVSNDLKKLIRTAKDFTGTQFNPASLTRLMAVAENYPQLVSSQPYKELVIQIAKVEGQIYDKRLQYSDKVNIYNTCLCTFPGNLIGRILRFRKQPYYSWENEAEWVFEGNSQLAEPPANVESDGSNKKLEVKDDAKHSLNKQNGK
ncbi:LemA family protein [Planctomycetota bacterium]